MEQIRTGDIPENFILFALGFLLVTVGQLLFACDLRQTIGRAWVLPLLAVAGLVVALTVTDGIHDIGLFVFEAAWVGLGVALLRAKTDSCTKCLGRTRRIIRLVPWLNPGRRP